MAAINTKLFITRASCDGSEYPAYDVIYCSVKRGTWFPKYGNLYAYRSRDGMRLFRRYGKPGLSKFDFDLIYAEFANDERGEATVNANDISVKTQWFIQHQVI